MAATSPYSGNDYQSVSNFRPYELPINDIFKSISAQNQFWDAGAARVKAVHDNALNLNLSLAPNKEIRRQFMEDAEKQLTKLSSMNLADASVQKQGFGIYKPLFKDEGIVYDDLATNHFQKVKADALGFRDKNNGKEYSDDNLKYAMNGYEEFINSEDRMAGKAVYEKRQEYTPYYDYTDDFTKALKDCPASSSHTETPKYDKNGEMTGYMFEEYYKGRSATQTKNCLEAGLSPKATRQLQIEGAVRYKNSPKALAEDVSTYLTGISSDLKARVQELTAEKMALSSNKDLTKEQATQKSLELDKQITALSDEIITTGSSITRIEQGDHADVLNNFDHYAGQMHSYKKLTKKALAAAYEERRAIYKGDPAQLVHIKFKQEEYLKQVEYNYDVSLKQMEFENDRQLKMLDIMYGGKGKDGAGNYVTMNPETGLPMINPNITRETPNLDANATPKVDEQIFQKMNTQMAELNTKDANNNIAVYNSLIDRGDRDSKFAEDLKKGFNYSGTWEEFKTATKNNQFSLSQGNKGGIQETSWFKAYMKLNPNDKDMDRWAINNSTVEMGRKTLERKLEIGEAQVSRELKGTQEDYTKEALNKIQPITVKWADGTIDNINARDIQDVLEGRVSKKGITITPVEKEHAKTGRKISSGGVGLVDNHNFIVKINGKISPTLQSFAFDIFAENKEINDKFTKKRVEVYNKLGFDREAFFHTPDDGKSEVSEILKARLLPTGADPKELDIKVLSSDFAGNIKVRVPGVKKDKDESLDAIRKAGLGTSVEAIEDNVVLIRGTKHNIIQQAINNPIVSQAAYQLETMTQTTEFKSTQFGAKVKGADLDIPIYVKGEKQTLQLSTYRTENGAEFRAYIKGANTTNAQVTASNAYELFDKVANLRIDLAKPAPVAPK